ncbi:MAG: Asp-tRNA(Asn)/Glu-tRNA(Gln) amidotransferase subunit GatC [Candidatus Omnitrophica bacterium]|nr:Asp-tRNA(Asn)/Glu-tRNA(Gln) amidotransferase subunit GatC [Candidatus Omnitrophota bacterium]
MINEDEVKHIAKLARISLKDEEIKKLQADLTNILDYVHTLDDLDVRNVPPTSHALTITNVYREDNLKPSLDQNEALGIAIKKHNGSFKVPKVIE